MRLSLVPVWKAEAYAFVREHHRHERILPAAWICGVGLSVESGMLVAVGILGKPVGRYSPEDSKMIGEITRCCTLGHRNACSRIYGALARAAAALGKRLVITYTREDESGSSLKAAGFVPVARVEPRQRDCPSRSRRLRDDHELVARIRWERRLTPPAGP